MRRTGFVLALPLVLPFLAGATAHAEDPAPPAPPTAPAAPKADAPKPDAPKAAPTPEGEKRSAPTKAEAPPAVSLIPFLTDYEAAKKQAAEQKKGLFIYLTPDWFT